MGYKTIYCQVICCYAKHCRSMVKKQSAIYLPISFHRSTPLQEVIPEIQVGFCTVRYRFSQSSLAKEGVMFW